MVQSDRDAAEKWQEWIDENAFIFYEWFRGGKARDYTNPDDLNDWAHSPLVKYRVYKSPFGDEIIWGSEGFVINSINEKELEERMAKQRSNENTNS